MLRFRAGLALLLLLAACRKDAPPPHPNRVTVATTQEPDALLPAFAESAAANQVLEGGIRYLTQYDRNWTLQPALAVRLPTVENGGVQVADGSGGMRVTWELRPDARWADGVPVTAQDFLFAHQVVMDPTQEVRDRAVAEKVARMSAPGPHTLLVEWKEPFAFYASYRNHAVLPAHAMGPLYRADGGPPPNLKNSSFATQPLFFGPFQLTEWKRGQHVILSRNPFAYAPPAVDQVVWRFIPSDQAAVAALEAGEVDALAPDGTVGVDLAEDLEKRHPGRFRVDYQPGMVLAHVDVNLEDRWLKDRRLRAALMHALDREGALRAVFRGRYAVAHGLFPPLHPGFSTTLTTYDHDVRQAAALLDAAGFPLGPENTRRDAQGQPLTLELDYATGQRTTEDLLAIFQANLAALGITLELHGHPARVFFAEVLKHRAFKHLAFYASFMDPTVYGETMVGSANVPTAANSWQGQGYAGYRDAEMDALLEAIPRTLDAAQRARLTQQVNAKVVRDLPLLPIYTRPVVSVVRRDLDGWQPTGTPTSVSWNIEQWRWRP